MPLPIQSVRDPRHARHSPPATDRCPPGACVAPPYVALCPRCDHPVNVPRDAGGMLAPVLDANGEPTGRSRRVDEPWRLRHTDKLEAGDG